MDNVRVYVYCSEYEVDEVMDVDLDYMVEEQNGPGEARELRRNLEETHMKMQGSMKSKLVE